MPGIYVRKASWIDWTQKGENPALMVPGSYWLCYKSNIYKFILRYHRTTRNINQFNYGRDLMKVIRRIIKSEPPQGQQFGTSNLLVIFNRTSWTRQDKIFALMKFKERSVVAFSHAFMLTIKLSQSLELKQDSTYATVSPISDQCLTYQNEKSNSACAYKDKNGKESKKYLMCSSTNDFSEKSTEYDNMQEATRRTENKSIQQHNSMLNGNLKNLSLSNGTVRAAIDNEDASTFSKNVNTPHKISITSKNCITFSNEVNEDNSNYLQEENHKHQLSPEKVHMRNAKFLNKHSAENAVKHRDDMVSVYSRVLNENSNIDDTNTDSANLPYQYLIEKEIENAKQNVKKPKLEEVNEKYPTDYTEESSDNMRIEDSPWFKKKKYNVQRSSDITDLVMEGLMFTIRQGQDAVAVIEQKTKLEVDEVLENSEQIETEEGEKYLRNSSLLGLENLITMIELPKENKSTNNTNERLFNNTKYALKNNIKPQTVAAELKHMQLQTPFYKTMVANTSIMNEHHYIEKHNNYKRNGDINFVKDKDSKFKESRKEEKKEATEVEEEEEEDIIPEALQNKIFQPSILTFKVEKSEDQLKFMEHKDLLMDDLNAEGSIKFQGDKNELGLCSNKNLQSKVYLKNDCPKNHEISMDFVKNETKKSCNNIICESKSNNRKKCTPVVVSNQIITLNEIPLPLQKILRNKLSSKCILNNESEKTNSDIETHKVQYSQKDNNVSNIQLENQNLVDNMLTNTQCSDHQKSIDNNKEVHNESTSSAILKIEVKELDISEKDEHFKHKNMQQQNNYTDKVEQLKVEKVKDITKEFYKNLSCLQKKNNVFNLRSRRKSMNVLSDANYGEAQIQMVKFFQDITRGAKVVIKRMNVSKYS